MPQPVPLLRTPLHACPYLPGRTAGNVVVPPDCRIGPPDYRQLLEAGFRRSGALCYRPSCPGCSACVPLRVDLARFTPNRAQRRCLRDNADLVPVQWGGLDDALLDLLRRYLLSRHRDGGMDHLDDDALREFLTAPWADTEIHGARLGGRPVAAIVADAVPGAMSAVYAFFDPAVASRSPGRWCLLRLIQVARSRGLRWLYLGYWIAPCGKMRYKSEYRPHEPRIGGRWQPPG